MDAIYGRSPNICPNGSQPPRGVAPIHRIGSTVWVTWPTSSRVSKEMDLGKTHLVGNSLGGWLALEIAVRSTAQIETLTLVSAAGIHVDGVPKGDIFLWDDNERVYNTFYDPKFAEARLAKQPSEEDANISLKNHFSTAKMAGASFIIQNCKNGCIGSTYQP